MLTTFDNKMTNWPIYCYFEWYNLMLVNCQLTGRLKSAFSSTKLYVSFLSFDFHPRYLNECLLCL